jgi:hypothetical protein
MDNQCPCTRAAYMALSVLFGFVAVFILFAEGGSAGDSRTFPSASAAILPGPAIPDEPANMDANGPFRVISPSFLARTVKSGSKAHVNLALSSNGATASGGQNTQFLIDGDEENYTGSTGFAMTQWNSNPPQSLVVTLKEASEIGCIRFLLWDRSDDRFYRYKLEVSPAESGDDWQVVQDCSAPTDERKSWQLIVFKPRLTRRVRLTGTYNSANSGFHVVELQSFAEAPPAKATEPDRLDF